LPIDSARAALSPPRDPSHRQPARLRRPRGYGSLPGRSRVSAPALVNAQGRTLYMFIPDDDKKVTCVGSCAEVWPPAFLPNGQKPVASGQTEQSLLGKRPRPGGRPSHHVRRLAPVHLRLRHRSRQGDRTGAEHQRGLWYVLSPSGQVIKTSPDSSPDPARCVRASLAVGPPARGAWSEPTPRSELAGDISLGGSHLMHREHDKPASPPRSSANRRAGCARLWNLPMAAWMRPEVPQRKLAHD